MRLLLDTHVAIWLVLNDSQLTPSIRSLIEDQSNDVAVSVVTLWEIAVKFPLARRGLGKMPMNTEQALKLFTDACYNILNLTASHALVVEHPPLLHADPFDRLLVAQAISEPMRLVTHDTAMAAYGGAIIYF